ncbi:MAG: ABC transporter ATP-binding protein/permease [Acidobacteriia bacterium]|nr:ABC transporter ATP-binding protein/permease [Terriglobia bacterium]
MSPYRRLLAYVLKYRTAFLLGLACVVITRAVALAAPIVLGRAIDDLTAGVTPRKLAAYGALLLAIGVVGGVFQFLQRRILIGASRDIEYDMRNDFFAHLQTLPLGYFQANRTGDLMSRATNDLNAVRMMIGPAIMYSANTLLAFVAVLTVMVSIDARLTLWSLVPLPFVSISVKVFGSAIHRRFERIQAQLSELSAVAQEALAGVRVVRAYRQEAAELDRFRRANEEYLRRNRRLIVLQGMFFPSMGFFLGLGALLVLWLGSRDVISGRLTVGQFVAFNAYLTMLSWPMIAFGWVTNMLQRGMASWKRMLEVLETRPAIADTVRLKADTTRPVPAEHVASGFSRTSPIRGSIEFRDLVFSYNGTRVLDHVSARIEAGQTVALVGVTGSGKSTLIALLARLHDPPPGTVFIDGVDVREMPLATLRAAIGFVPQEPFLFSDTLADNVAFGLDATGAGGAGQAGGEERSARLSAERDKRIRDAAAVARLDKDVADFPKGYETMVGERGITLSGGQKQRTALARAIAVDPRILILDDALSAVDTYTEEEILSRLRGVMRKRTSIIVSHRISTVRDADVIFVLDAGRIVERGTHDELVRANGLYAELHKKQLLEEELAAS